MLRMKLFQTFKNSATDDILYSTVHTMLIAIFSQVLCNCLAIIKPPPTPHLPLKAEEDSRSLPPPPPQQLRNIEMINH